MPKFTVQDWDTVAANNTDVGGINILGGAPTSNFDDALRETMAQLATFLELGVFEAVGINRDQPRLRLLDTNGPTDEKIVDITNDDGNLYFYARKDDVTGAAPGLVLVRGTANVFDYTYIPVQLRVSNTGTQELPSWCFFGDPNTGMYPKAANSISTSTNGLHRTNVDANGNFLVGPETYTAADFSTVGFRVYGATGTVPGSIVNTVSGGACYYLNRLASNGNVVEINRDTTLVGAISATTTLVTYGTSSDQRLKQNFADFDSGALIDAMTMYHYEWKPRAFPDDEIRTGYGPKAQELYEVFPDAVVPGNDKEPGEEGFEPWTWGGSPLIAVLIREIQSLRARVAALEA